MLIDPAAFWQALRGGLLIGAAALVLAAGARQPRQAKSKGRACARGLGGRDLLQRLAAFRIGGGREGAWPSQGIYGQGV